MRFVYKFSVLLALVATAAAADDKPKGLSDGEARELATTMILVQDAQIALQQAQLSVTKQLQPLEAQLNARVAKYNEILAKLRQDKGAAPYCNPNASQEWVCEKPAEKPAEPAPSPEP